MRLAYMGTPAFSVPVLAELLTAGHDVVAVYTRAPQPSGRGHHVTPSPVHRFAEDHGLDVHTPRSFKPKTERDIFHALNVDAAVVVAYGLILPQAVLDAPRYGCFNLHASLLPRWRGAAPIHRAIMAGDDQTGVQVMRMEAGLDTGPVLLSEIVEIKPEDTTGSLHDRLAQIGAQLMPRALAAVERGALIETPQAEQGVTYAEKITPAQSRIDWLRPAHEVDCHIRGLSPFPGAWFEAPTEKDPIRVKVLFSRLVDGSGAPGGILENDGRLIVACGDGAIELVRLQRAGKAVQEADVFLRGASLDVGRKL